MTSPSSASNQINSAASFASPPSSPDSGLTAAAIAINNSSALPSELSTELSLELSEIKTKLRELNILCEGCDFTDDVPDKVCNEGALEDIQTSLLEDLEAIKVDLVQLESLLTLALTEDEQLSSDDIETLENTAQEEAKDFEHEDQKGDESDSLSLPALDENDCMFEFDDL